MRGFLSRFAQDDCGATAIEYGLIIALMVVVILTALTAFGNTTSSVFNTAMEALREAMSG